MTRLRGTIIVLEIFEDPARVFRGTLRTYRPDGLEHDLHAGRASVESHMMEMVAIGPLITRTERQESRQNLFLYDYTGHLQ